MALEVSLKKKEADESDVLPDGEEVQGADVVEAQREEQERLKLENAEMKGKLSVLQQGSKTDLRSTHEQAKARVYADVNNLSDEDFERAYRMPKHQATATILDRENSMTRDESARAIAEAEAKTELAMKYGKDFYTLKSQVEDTLSDLSDEARKDSKRVARYMERQYLAFANGTKPTSVKSDDTRRKITQDFEPPTPTPDKSKKIDEPSDEIAETDRDLARALKLTSEKERKEYKDMGDYVPMNMGGGKWLRDPAKGFETIAPAK